MKVYIFQRKISTLSRITEVYVFEINIAVFHLCNSIRSVFHLRHFIKYFRDTVCGRLCNHNHCKYKGNHHQRHQNLQRIHNNAGQLSGLHRTCDNTLSADEHHDNNHRIYSELHNRGVPCHNLLRFCKKLKYQCRYLAELFNFMFSADIGLYNSCRIDIFLYSIVEDIVLVKYLDEMRMRHLSDCNQRTSENRYRDQHDNRDLYADRQSHNQRQDNHDRRSGQQPDREHICHLHVCDVCRHPRHKA